MGAAYTKSNARQDKFSSVSTAPASAKMKVDMAARVLLLLALAAALAFPQSKYTGPRPPKPDIPYLLQADRLIETEAVDAKEETKKDDTIYSVPGAASSAKTPLAEPAFLFEAKNVQPDRLQLYKLESKNGRREILMKRKRPQRPVHLSISVSHPISIASKPTSTWRTENTPSARPTRTRCSAFPSIEVRRSPQTSTIQIL